MHDLFPATIRKAVGIMIALATGALACGSVFAGEPEARDVARQANCQPGKIEVLHRQTGVFGETVYKISCSDARDMFVLVQCRSRQCVLLR